MSELTDLTNSVDNLIDRIKELNTRQKIALEENKIIKQELLLLCNELDKIDFNDEMNKEYKSEFDLIKIGVSTLLEDDLDLPFKERKLQKENLVHSIVSLIEKIKARWEEYLDEYTK